MAISKQIHEIRTFSRGIMSKPDDERDAPDNAAITSLNIENIADGELRGIPRDLVLKSTGFNTEYSDIFYEQGGRTFTTTTYATLSNRIAD